MCSLGNEGRRASTARIAVKQFKPDLRKGEHGQQR